MKFFTDILLSLKKHSSKKCLFFMLILFTVLTLIMTEKNSFLNKRSKKTNFSSKFKYSKKRFENLKNSFDSIKGKIKNLLENKQSSPVKKQSTSQSEVMFQPNYYDFPVPSEWNSKIGIAYRDLAGIGYMTKNEFESQLNEIRKGAQGDISKISAIMRVLFEIQNWEYIGNYTDKSENFSFNVIRNKQKGKVVLAFSGTKSTAQLMNQFAYSGGKIYFRESLKSSKYIMIMEYFQTLYIQIFPYLKELIEKAKHKSIKQYIFVGHSLGGAMASLAVFDLMHEKLIKKTSISPVLITFGQPRVGNYAFANELMKSVSIVYRIVNKFDVVPGIPPCKINQKTKNCRNESEKQDINLKFSDYEIPSKGIWNRLLGNTNFLPWHFGGLIYNKAGNNSIECANSEPKFETDCRLETSSDVDYHIYYFGYKIHEIQNPEIFGYNLVNKNINNAESIEKSGKSFKVSNRKSIGNMDFEKAPPPFVLGEKPKIAQGISGTIGSELMKKLKNLNFINRKK